MAEDHVIQALRADFRAAREAFDSREFQLIHVCANRMAGNLLYADPSHAQSFGFLSYVLKNVGVDLLNLDLESDEASQFLDISETLLDELDKIISEPIVQKAVWEAFSKYTLRTSIHRSSPPERKAYKEPNPEFTRCAVRYIVDQALIDPEILYSEQSRFLLSAISELDRVIRVHGFQMEDLMALSFLHGLKRIFEYAYRDAHRNSGFDEPTLKSRIEPFVKRVVDFRRSVASDDLFDRASAVMCELVLEWRRCFLKFFELSKSAVKETKIELPAEVKQKVTDSITKVLQGQVEE